MYTSNNLVRLEDFSVLEDGFTYYFPKCGVGYSSDQLRKIAFELDRLNMKKQMEEDCASLNKNL